MGKMSQDKKGAQKSNNAYTKNRRQGRHCGGDCGSCGGCGRREDKR